MVFMAKPDKVHQLDFFIFKVVAYVRPKFEDMEYVGQLHWIWEREREIE